MADRPSRIQRGTDPGWRMPPNAVAIDGEEPWRNPFALDSEVVGRVAKRLNQVKGERAARHQAAAQLYATWLAGMLRRFPPDVLEVLPRPLPVRPTVTQIREALRGRDLVCSCPLEFHCHADPLLELANGGDDA